MKKVVLLLSLAFLASCSNQEGTVADVDTKAQDLQQIDSVEKILYASEQLNSHAASVALDMYSKFSKNYPEDEKTADYLFKAAGIARAIGQYKKAITFYEHVYDRYPDYDYAIEALYQQGLVYDDHLNDSTNARRIYETVVEKYPDHQYAKDAQVLIDYLGKSDEELIQLFEEKNQ